MKRSYQIQGMSCVGCVALVRRALLEIPAVEAADVQLNPQLVLLTMQEEIAIEVLQSWLRKAGN